MAGIGNISEFRSTVIAAKGFQRTNRFRVRLPVPPILAQTDATRYLEYYCNTADLPGVALATRPIVRYGYGSHEKKPVFSLFNDIMLTFLNDTGNENLIFFQTWMQSINNFRFDKTIADTNRGSAVYELSYKEEYVVDAEISLIDTHGDIQYTMRFHDFYPIGIAETKMQWEPTPTMMSIVVMFTFVDWWIDTTEFVAPVQTTNGVGTAGATTTGSGTGTGSNVQIGDVNILPNT
jgi:hypothetical protein